MLDVLDRRPARKRSESEAQADERVSEWRGNERRRIAPRLSYTLAPHAPVFRGEDKRAHLQLLLWERE